MIISFSFMIIVCNKTEEYLPPKLNCVTFRGNAIFYRDDFISWQLHGVRENIPNIKHYSPTPFFLKQVTFHLTVPDTFVNERLCS